MRRRAEKMKESETIPTERPTQASETIQREKEEPKSEMTRRELVRTTEGVTILRIFRLGGEERAERSSRERRHKWDAEREV